MGPNSAYMFAGTKNTCYFEQHRANDWSDSGCSCVNLGGPKSNRTGHGVNISIRINPLFSPVICGQSTGAIEELRLVGPVCQDPCKIHATGTEQKGGFVGLG